MIKAMIADDNSFALQYLENIIDWESYGFKIICTAVDGMDAWKKYKEFKPQLVITDIQMPGYTGIKLAENIRKYNDNVIIIFLSSYNEFDYVRSAVNLNVFDYILKQELNEDLLKSKLVKIRNVIKKKYELRKFLIEEKLRILFDRDEKYLDLDLIKDELRRRYSLFLVEQDSYLPLLSKKFSVYNKEISKNEITNIIYTYFDNEIFIIKLEKYRYLCLIEQKSIKNECLYKLKSELENNLKVYFSIFLLCEDKKINEIGQAFYISKDIIKERYFMGKSIVFNYLLHTNSNVYNEKVCIDKIKRSIEKLSRDNLLREIDSLYIPIIQSRDYKMFCDILEELLEILKPYNDELLDYESGKIFKILYEGEENNWFVASDIIYWLKRKFLYLIELKIKYKNYKYTKEVQKAIQYIYQRYSDCNLSVDEIANHTNLGVNRLNILFKQETNETIGKYLTNTRMRIAKEFIEDINFKVSEIDKKVGYMSCSYFSKVFKKYYGLTPKDYRRKIMNDKNKSY